MHSTIPRVDSRENLEDPIKKDIAGHSMTEQGMGKIPAYSLYFTMLQGGQKSLHHISYNYNNINILYVCINRNIYMYVCMDGCIDVCIYVCMDVFIYLSIYLPM